MHRLLILVPILLLGQNPSPLPTAVDSLTTVGRRAMHNVAAGDWNAFRRDAAPGVCVEWFERGYDQYFTADFQSPESKKHDLKSRYVVELQWLDARKPLDKDGKHAFDLMRQVFADRRSADRDWSQKPTGSEGFEPWGGEADGLNGPAISDTVASNLDCFLQMENSTGRWRVFRIVVAMH